MQRGGGGDHDGWCVDGKFQYRASDWLTASAGFVWILRSAEALFLATYLTQVLAVIIIKALCRWLKYFQNCCTGTSSDCFPLSHDESRESVEFTRNKNTITHHLPCILADAYYQRYAMFSVLVVIVRSNREPQYGGGNETNEKRPSFPGRVVVGEGTTSHQHRVEP